MRRRQKGLIIIARGTIAKQVITKKLQDAFGADFLGEFDKKIYLQAPENGEMVQIAISMTCPKNTIEVSNAPAIKNGMIDFESQEMVVTNSQPDTEVSVEEKTTIIEMMKRLGL
jgi:hypothetical protein